MGANSSRDSLGGSSVVMVVRAGGKKETYSRPVSAQEIMIRHPQDVLTRLHVRDSDTRKSIVTPETVLLPGNKYYLVRRRTVEWLLNSPLHSAMALGFPSTGNNYTSDETLHSVPLDHIVFTVSTMDSITASPPGFVDDQVYSEKERIEKGKSPKFDSLMPPKSPSQLLLPKSSSCWSPKWSPPGCSKGSEANQRPWRSSPKVCPGEDNSSCDEQLLDISLSSLSQAGPVKDEMDGRLPMQEPCMLKLTETKCRKVYLAPELPYDSCPLKLIEEMCKNAHLASELPDDSSGPAKTTLHVHPVSHLPQLFVAPRDQTSDELGEKHGQKVSCNTSSDRCVSMLSPEEKAVGLNQSSGLVIPSEVKISQREMEIPFLGQCISSEEPHKKSLLELLKRPDLIVFKPFVNEQQGIQILTHGVDKEVKETVEVPDTVDILLGEACQFNDDDASVMFEDEVKGNADEGKGGTLFVVESDSMSCILQENARVWQPKILSDALSEDEQRGGHREPYSENVSQDQLKEGCAYLGDLQTFNLMVPPVVGICNEPGAQCPFGEKKSAAQDSETTCDCKSFDVDGSYDNRSTKELNTRPQVQTLGDVFSRRSPNYLELIDAGSEINGLPKTLSAAASSLSVAPLSSLLTSSSSSSFLAPPSSMAVSRLPPSKAFLSSPSSRAPLSASASSSGASLSLLMEFDAPATSASDPSESSFKEQGNLALLGFNSLRGNRMSIHEQAKAHARAHRFMMGKPSKSASSNISSTTKQKQECRHPSDQGDMERQEAWMPSTSQQCGSPQLLSPRRVRNLLLRGSKKQPLSPIPELSPEQSPASIS